MATKLTTVKRGPLEGYVMQDGNRIYLQVFKSGRKIKESDPGKPYYDQEEAEIELGSLIDTAWREDNSLPKQGTVRRI